jgi:hypothetical protein
LVSEFAGGANDAGCRTRQEDELIKNTERGILSDGIALVVSAFGRISKAAGLNGKEGSVVWAEGGGKDLVFFLHSGIVEIC